MVIEGVRRCGLDPVMVYLQITRGAGPRSLAYSADVEPTVVATFRANPMAEIGAAATA